ncbi:MAG: hypothetical protein DMG35_10115 [Acidobacteria bacterium]|nr:MAG: hypothetical protein DMG35_10115 [Acidobacteriota bacterium]
MIASVLSSLVLLLLFSFTTHAQAQWWKVQTSGVDTNLRGVSVVNVPDGKGVHVPVVWASGSNGVILKSLDEGKTWKRLHVAGGEALDFRGIVAFNASVAYVMSSGEGEKSRIYKTTDGGETWKLQYTDRRKEFFLDAIACLSEKDCVALSDPIDGKFLLLKTTDGEQWSPLPSDNIFGTGGSAARVFRSWDRGHSWTVAETPIIHGNASSGIFSIGADENNRVIVLGGDYKEPNRSSGTAAYSLDGGKTWQLAAQMPGGYRSALATLTMDAGWPSGRPAKISPMITAFTGSTPIC